jgi:hypothetical protein
VANPKSWLARVLLATSLGGCIQASVFARPEIVYSTPTTVGVRYVAVGVQSRGNETEAMKLVAQHCNGRFQVTGRNESGAAGRMTIDAVCVQ